MRHQLVTLTLDGDLASQGFRVTMEIGADGQRPDAVITGALPADPDLQEQLNAWQQVYRQLDAPSRIRPKEIVYIGSIQQVKACERMAQALRQQFNRWLSAETFRAIDRLLREELHPDDSIRLVIRTANPDLHQLPWHLWEFLDRYTQAEVTLSAPHFKRPSAIAPAVSHQVNILAILGHSAGIDISCDRALLSSLPNANVTFLVEPQRQGITNQLWECPWDILFFAGHSDSASDNVRNRSEVTGRIFLNPQESLTLEELKYGLRRAIARGLKLAIFNSCDGLGLAHDLESLNLPQIIVMRQPVPDRIAQLFLTYLLPAYAAGQSLPLALRQARERLQGMESEFPCASWLPVLYQTAPDAPPTWSQLQRAEAAPAIPPAEPSSPQPQWQLARWRLALFTSLAVSALILVIRSMGGFQAWELRAYDRLLLQRLPQVTPQRILVIEATEDDVNRYGYPLPDDVLAAAIDRLEPYNPSVIGLDIFRDRIDPNSSLQAQLAEQDNLVGLCSAQIARNEAQSGIAPPPQLPSDRLGFSNVLEDHDGILRRQLLFMEPETDDPCATSFSLGALLAIQHLYTTANIQPENLPSDHLQLGKTQLVPLAANSGPYHNLDHWGFQILLNYADPDQFMQRVTLSDVVSDDFSLQDPMGNPISSLQQYVVLIGMSAPVSNPTDYFTTPAGAQAWPRERIPGVILQAQMINQLLTAGLDGRAPINTWSKWAETLWMVGWAGIGGLIGWRCQRPSSTALASGLAVLGLYGLAWGLLNLGLWVPLVPAAIGLISTSSGTVIAARLLAQTDVRRRLR